MGPAAKAVDKQFWDRIYMSERELADLSRDGIRCKTPCNKVTINAEPNYIEKSKYGY